jgi:hypothetical protein
MQLSWKRYFRDLRLRKAQRIPADFDPASMGQVKVRLMTRIRCRLRYDCIEEPGQTPDPSVACSFQQLREPKP